MKLRALLFVVALLGGACAKEEVVLLTVDAGGSTSGGASSGGALQGGAAQGGVAQGGAAQGGVAQGGAAQGGLAQGGASQGGTADGGSPQAGGTFGGGGGIDGGTSCHSDADCDVSSSCQKARCGDDRGRCEARPLFCSAKPDPVCGCDNVNYWNDCWRRQLGSSPSVQGTSGECRTPSQCRSSSECPGGAFGQCARLIPMNGMNGMNGQCGPGAPPIPGSCWVVPDVCDPTQDSRRWIDCVQGSGCLDTCNAIYAGHPFFGAPPGACP